jgi:predicted O-methyltransferase YrrM
VDGYLARRMGAVEPALAAALRASAAAGLPAIQVSPVQGRFLRWLVRSRGARSVLEIGTLGGYSALWLAGGLPSGGRLVTLEREPRHAEVARKNVHRAGLEGVVKVRVGGAVELLDRMRREGAPPFDFVFIDADKTEYAEYLAGVLPLAHPGTLLVADNVVRGGAVADPRSTDPRVVGVRRFLARIASDPRLCSCVLPTASAKGYDGMAFALVVGER